MKYKQKKKEENTRCFGRWRGGTASREFMLEQSKAQSTPQASQRRAQTDELGAEPREERWDADGSSVPSARLRISHVLRQLKRTVEAALFHIGVLFRTMGL